MTEKLTLGKPSSLLEGKTVGEAPFGIPVNIHIKGKYDFLWSDECNLHAKDLLDLLLHCSKSKECFYSIADCPPVLFEVSCSNNGVQIGGYPWHYIYTPPHERHKGTHHICSLKDSTMVDLVFKIIQYIITFQV